MFTVSCPHCDMGYLVTREGSTMFGINERHPASAKCEACGLESRIPKRCYGDLIDRGPESTEVIVEESLTLSRVGQLLTPRYSTLERLLDDLTVPGLAVYHTKTSVVKNDSQRSVTCEACGSSINPGSNVFRLFDHSSCSLRCMDALELEDLRQWQDEEDAASDPSNYTKPTIRERLDAAMTRYKGDAGGES